MFSVMSSDLLEIRFEFGSWNLELENDKFSSLLKWISSECQWSITGWTQSRKVEWFDGVRQVDDLTDWIYLNLWMARQVPGRLRKSSLPRRGGRSKRIRAARRRWRAESTQSAAAAPRHAHQLQRNAARHSRYIRVSFVGLQQFPRALFDAVMERWSAIRIPLKSLDNF